MALLGFGDLGGAKAVGRRYKQNPEPRPFITLTCCATICFINLSAFEIAKT